MSLRAIAPSEVVAPYDTGSLDGHLLSDPAEDVPEHLGVVVQHLIVIVAVISDSGDEHAPQLARVRIDQSLQGLWIFPQTPNELTGHCC